MILYIYIYIYIYIYMQVRIANVRYHIPALEATVLFKRWITRPESTKSITYNVGKSFDITNNAGSKIMFVTKPQVAEFLWAPQGVGVNSELSCLGGSQDPCPLRESPAKQGGVSCSYNSCNDLCSDSELVQKESVSSKSELVQKELWSKLLVEHLLISCISNSCK